MSPHDSDAARDSDPTEEDILRERNDALKEQARLEAAIRAALNELGVPGEGYPAPVANAHEILSNALLGHDIADA